LGWLTTGRMLAGLALGGALMSAAQTAATTPAKNKVVTAAKKAPPKPAGAKKTTTVAGNVKARGLAAKGHAVRATAASKAVTERVLKLNSAFTASAQLRPMAQQLASTRTAAAYAGVMSYAGSHPGAGAATAYLALGHAYALDHRFADAADAYKRVGGAGDALSDYSDYLGAQALVAANRSAEVFPLLDHFAERHPESIFDGSAPLL